MVLHCSLLVASLASLPVIADASWKPVGGTDPTLWILLLLVSTVGLPYFLLSTTGPLIQAWVSRTLVGAQVYRYFSLSNLASLIALISYPFLIEPHARLATQAWSWSAVYLGFIVLCAACAVYVYRVAQPLPAGAPQAAMPQPGPTAAAPSAGDHVLWLGLSAMGSWLLVAITNHLTQNVAAIPFLWLLPLTLYLLTFVLCFESERWYRRGRWLAPAAVLLGLCAYALQAPSLGSDVKLAIPLYAGGLFVLCMFLHGELATMKPAPRYLTRFYLMLSLGGALGGAAVALLAPRVLPAYYELGIGFVIVALLAVAVLRPRRLWAGGAGLLAVLCAYFLWAQVDSDFRDARQVARSFYGTLLTLDVHRDEPADSVRQLYHGSVKHGEQYLAAHRRSEPTAYYGQTSGVGRAIAASRQDRPMKVGLIGLGAGTLAAYGREGDLYRFYEINPQVLDFARREFTFLQESRARVETALGDARLLLEQERPNGFDVLAVDAFSADSIPIHLLTREAMAVYRSHIHEQGVIAFHVTNRFLALAPLVALLARDQGMHAALVHDEAVGSALRKTDWVLVARDPAVLQRPGLREAASPIEPAPSLRVWTDDFNNLLQVLK
ncbi:fused MFS/spermidine synthase [Ramlibacter rhizophilus]|uniref:fused MFS/spermidine synthase n=1 Tax=Ramlibacter rhizophilus TaxID=1781167 RepID=UPI001F0FA3A8|nr:fused MFS/spermidine synthase [Ramlibacter rhizophilus]